MNAPDRSGVAAATATPQVAQATTQAKNAAVPLIELQGVTKTYRNGEMAVEVLHGIDLKIYRGEFVAIMGASGSGKSTLMNILGCLDRPTTGRYLFAGRDVSQFESDELAALRREAFGFVFQSYNLIATANARENVEVPAVYAGMPQEERRVRAEQLLTTLGLAERMEHRPNQLSGGQQQRVSIARALMNGGNVILADEPTGALDSKSGEALMKLLHELSEQGHTVILITHSAEVGANAHRLIEIKDGDILADPGPRLPDHATPDFQPSRDRTSPLADLFEATRTALRALRANLLRTVLTLLGIVIGVGSVISMLAIGDGAKQVVIDRISAMGSNLLTVRPGAPNTRGRDTPATLVPADVDAIRTLDNVITAVPEQSSNVTARYGGNDHRTEINATSAEYVLARDWPVERGAFFTSIDEVEYAPVAVLGQTVAKALFGDEDPVGQHIVLNNAMFKVTGVMRAQGAAMFGRDQDDIIFVPYSTGSMRLFGQRFLRNVTVAVQDVSRIDDTQAEVEKLLTERHGTVDFQIRNMASIIETASETQNTMTILLGSIAAISLLVGGIGVMNIMLVSVTERTREIGIRMATGARRGNILHQFLIEAVVVSAIGGAIGVAGGLGVAALIASFGTPIKYTLAPVLLAFGCAFATGLIFGFLPARKAAGLDPVVALAAE